MRKIELYVSFILDSKSSSADSAKQANLDISQIEADLKEANDAYISLSKKVNSLPPGEQAFVQPDQQLILPGNSLSPCEGQNGSEFILESLLMKVQALAIQ